jgi:hypothetical protein
MSLKQLPVDGGFINYGGATAWATLHTGFNGRQALQLLLEHDQKNKSPAKPK